MDYYDSNEARDQWIQQGKENQESAYEPGLPKHFIITPNRYGLGWTQQKAGEGLRKVGFDEAAADSPNPLTGDAADVDAVGNSDSAHWRNETPFPWEKWEKLPKEERETEAKEAMKEYLQAKDLRQQIINQGGGPDTTSLNDEVHTILSGANEEEAIDALTGETTNTENVGEMSNRVTSTGGTMTSQSWYNGVSVSGDVSADLGSPETDALTGDVPADAEARAIEWCRMHSKCIYEGDLDVSQADSLTGEATNTENAGGNVSWMSPEDRKEAGLEFDQDYPAFKFEFDSNPQTLTPINIDSALITNAYQHKDAPGANLIDGDANQGMDPYQAQREQYEVLA